MANEHDVLTAWLQIGREDTAATVGLVALVGRASPIVTYGSIELAELPVIVLPFMPTSSVFGGAPYRRPGTWHVEARVPHQSLKLGYQMLDRLEEVTNYAAFAALGLDVQVRPGARSPEAPGEVPGYRLIADYRLTVKV